MTESTVRKAAEIIPVGDGKNGVRVWLEVYGGTETWVCIERENTEDAKNMAEKSVNQEILILRKHGYEHLGEWSFPRMEEGKEIIVIKHIFHWSDWKYDVMRRVRECA